jgi:hypothetical protein
MTPHPDHRFHWNVDGNPFEPAYDDKLLASIAANRYGAWSAEDSRIANDVLAWRLDYPRR